MAVRRPIITLTTDFGLNDEYVGSLKGVILSFLPDVQIIDITHAIAPQDIQGATGILARSCGFFPDSTVHLAVVDPGVGSDRPLLALRTAKYFFVGPDNGIFTTFLQSETVQIHQIVNNALFRSPVSRTFEGRDIMAPVAAQLAMGMAIKEVGPTLTAAQCCILDSSKPVLEGNRLYGEIVSHDHFGNLRTNISEEAIRMLTGTGHITLEIGGRRISGLRSAYSEAESGKLIALLDSSGFVEIAVVCGSAQKEINPRISEAVIMISHREEQ